MGGMIAQLLAINHPDRVLSLASIMSTTGNRRVGKPQPRMMMRLMRKGARKRDAYIEDHIDTYRAIGSKGYDFEEERKRERAARMFDRGVYPAGSARQLGAVASAADRTAALGRRAGPHHGHPRRRRSARRRLRGPRHRRGHPRAPGS